MTKFEFLLEAIRRGAYQRKAWLLSLFSITHSKSLGQQYYIRYSESGVYGLLPDETTEVLLEGTVHGQPLFYPMEKISLKQDDLANVDRDIETTVGNVIANAMVLIYPFNDKVPFVVGRFNKNSIEKHVCELLIDNKEGKNNPKAITVDELLKFNEAVGALTGLSTVVVPTGTAKTFTIDPAIIKRRDELLAEYKDQLHDPAIIAKIEKELIDMDKASFKGDLAEGFLIGKKSFDVARKRMFIMLGIEMGFGDTKEAIGTSLNEGIDVNNLPTLIDAMRAGSYGRGKETELGGEQVKYFYRVYQNTRVEEPDCGTKRGLTWTIDDSNYKNFVGLYLANDAQEVLTESALKAMVGKTVEIRSPMYCNTKAPGYCAKCVGDAYSANPNALLTAASNVGSVMMNWFMKKMHGVVLKTTKLDWSDALR